MLILGHKSLHLPPVFNFKRRIMKFIVQAVGFTADQKLLDLVDKKIDKLDKFKDHIVDGEVFLRVDNNTHNIKDKTAEVKCHVKGQTLFSKETTKSFEESVDLAVDSLTRQVKKYKEQL